MSDCKNISTLITAEQISGRVRELGRQISLDFPAGNLVLVGLMKGAMIFLADLIREINVPIEYELISVQSYGSQQTAQQPPRITVPLSVPIDGRNVILVDDIYDNGNSINAAQEHILENSPGCLKTCILLEKDKLHEIWIKVAYLGFKIPDKFVVGYGLDLAGAHRNLPYIGIINPKESNKL